MQKRKIFFLSLILVAVAIIFVCPEVQVVYADSITITFDYNISRISQYLPNNFLSNLTTTNIELDSPSTLTEPSNVSIGVLRYYDYVWTIDGEEIDLNTYVFSTSTVVKAEWTPIKYTIYYNYLTSEERDEITNFESVDYYSIEEPVVYYRPIRAGYAFVDWYSSSKFQSNEIQIFTEQYSLGDKVLYARFEPIVYYINFHTNATNMDNPNVYTIESPTYILQSPQMQGHIFEGWYLDKDLTRPVTEIASGSTGNMDIYPKWELESYKVTYILPNGQTQIVNAKYGTKADKPNIEKSIFQVISYNKSIDNISEDMTVEVKLINIWYVYVIALLVIVAIVVGVIYYIKNKYKKMHKLRYIYQSNSNKRK